MARKPTTKTMTFSRDNLVAEVKRELAMRRQVYAGQVSAHKMRQSEADWCLTCMRGVQLALENELSANFSVTVAPERGW